MAVYAIGDVQGCYAELRALLEKIRFDPAVDRLWLAGDLVNRGPSSLEVLRFVSGLGERAVSVLGNHDLHLLAAVSGTRAVRGKDTFGDVLAAPDRDAILHWLRHRPVLHADPELGYLMVHAGLAPQWTAEQAARLAGELENTLRGERHLEFFAHMYGNEPAGWSDDLAGWERLRFLTNAFTRIRYVDGHGRLELEENGPPGRQADGLVPWFAAPGRASTATRIVFGHWAALQSGGELDARHGVFHVDTGCVWGGALTALRLEDQRYFSVPGRGANRRSRVT